MKSAKIIGLCVSLGLMLGQGCGKIGDEDIIQKDKQVTLNYTLKVDGQVINSTVGKEPFQFVYGSGKLVPGLEKALEGLKTGTRLHVVIPPEEGFGLPDPQGVMKFPRTQFPAGEIKMGSVMSSPGPNGQNVTAVVEAVDEENVTLNFNHPLAGKELEYDVEVVKVS